MRDLDRLREDERELGRPQQQIRPDQALDRIEDAGLGSVVHGERVDHDHRVVKRVGDNREIPVDVRILASTNADLETAVARRILKGYGLARS